MQDYYNNLDVNQYLPVVLNWGVNILLAILILIVGIWLARKANALVLGVSSRYQRLDDTLFKFFGSVVKYTILAFVGIAVLNRFGVQTASIIALMGAAGLAVGLALQGTLSNLAAGVMLLIFRPYKVDDFVEIAGKQGHVVEIDMFTTILKTFDHQQIIIPNSQIWGEQIINHSHHDVRGVEMIFGIAYQENIDEARAVIESVFEQHSLVLSDPAPFIEVETLNNSSVDFLVRPFCKSEHYFDLRYSVPELVKKGLDEAGIEIPFPHRKVIVVHENDA